MLGRPARQDCRRGEPARSIIPLLAFYQRSGFTPYRRQIEIADDPRIAGILPRDSAGHIPLID